MGGGDKPLGEVGGRTILARVIARLAPLIQTLVKCLRWNASVRVQASAALGAS
jgi:molybdopterin-guanine dinucleotide biosynthesis protein A